MAGVLETITRLPNFLEEPGTLILEPVMFCVIVLMSLLLIVGLAGHGAYAFGEYLCWKQTAGLESPNTSLVEMKRAFRLGAFVRCFQRPFRISDLAAGWFSCRAVAADAMAAYAGRSAPREERDEIASIMRAALMKVASGRVRSNDEDTRALLGALAAAAPVWEADLLGKLATELRDPAARRFAVNRLAHIRSQNTLPMTSDGRLLSM